MERNSESFGPSGTRGRYRVSQPTGNHLELKIVNLWPNRLIGDDSLPAEKQYTKFNMRNYYETPICQGLASPAFRPPRTSHLSDTSTK